MIYKLGLTTVAVAALLTGCGGGGSSSEKTITEQIAERDAVVIIHNANLAFCETLKNLMAEDTTVKDIISDTPANTVSCSTYNKVASDIDDEEAECINTSLAYFSDAEDISIYEDTETACVVGINEI